MFKGESAKTVHRASFSKSRNSTMAAPSHTSNVPRRSSIACEKPEKLSSRGPSPYLTKVTFGNNPGSGVNRRVQSAATTRQKSALTGPTVKASEFFRKNQSEPPLPGNRSHGPSTFTSNRAGSAIPAASYAKLNKPVKQVRIDTDKNLSSTSSSSRYASSVASPRLLGIRGTKSFTHGRTGPSEGEIASGKKPFSFCSDRSRSVSVTSNESYSAFDNDHEDNNIGSGSNSDLSNYKKDFENNNETHTNSNLSSRNSSAISSDSQSYQHQANPPLQKRAYSMDAGEIDSDHDDRFWISSPQQDFKDRFEMKIAEHPEDVPMEENKSASRSQSRESMKSRLNRTLTVYNDDDERPVPSRSRSVSMDRRPSSLKGSDIDRMLIRQSDSLLEGVDILINEINSSETSKQQKKSSSTASNAGIVEQMVEDLKNDINKHMYDSSLAGSTRPPADKQHQRLSTVDERFNFNSLDLSGIELSEITCPSQVMEQSMPNTGRLERPLSAVVLGNNNGNNMCIIEEAENYLMMNRDRANSNCLNSSKSIDGLDSLSDSNNQTVSSSEALSIIQQQVSTGSARNGSGRVESSHSNHGFDINQEEIQRKLCSALRLLEEEEKLRVKNSSRGESLSSRHGTNSERSHTPYVSTSNPDSRPESQGGCRTESDSSSRNRSSNDKNVLHSSRESHPSKQSGDGGPFSMQNNTATEQKCLVKEPQSARSCSCLLDQVSNESLSSARSCKTTNGVIYPCLPEALISGQATSKGMGGGDGIWDTKDDKTKQIFTFLDQVEKSDQEILFGLRFEADGLSRTKGASTSNLLTGSMMSNEITSSQSGTGKTTSKDGKHFRTMDSLIRKGSVELAREILLLERKLDEAQHAVKLLEESLLNQRELNIRNLRSSERDFKKRMRMQKEEFDIAFSRNDALINEMATEKRFLLEKLEKLIKKFEDMEEKHKDHIKGMQQKHLDEIRRLRKMQQNAENSLKKNLAGNKIQAQEIRDMTVKGLEPEVQRIIQRHQQEMSEMRAWHADEVREIEDRYSRKLHMQLEDLRQKFMKEKEDLIESERELAHRRLQAELKQKDDEIEGLRRKHANEVFEERERAVSEEMKLKDHVQECVRKAQIKGEVELENLRQEYEIKLANLERKHEGEIKSIKDVYEAERQNWATNQMKKLEQALADQETKLREAFQIEKEKDWREKEKKLKEEYENFHKEEEVSNENRLKRMQEKFQSEINEMDRSEKDIKSKFSQAKTDLLVKEEELFTLKASVSMKDKQLADLQEMNMKMQEERVNLTSVIRREFTDQIQVLEDDCRSLKSSIVEMQSNCKLAVEQKQLEIEKIVGEKDAEIEKIGLRVKQALSRKDETILELQKQLEKSSFQIAHLEELLEEQRKEFVHGMTKMSNTGGRGQRK